MSTGLLHTHSLLRYFVLILLLAVIIKSMIGWLNNKPFGKADNKLSLFLLIFTHIQLLVGLILYLVSDRVQFNSETMKNDTLRYWAVEHLTGMIIAVVLITLARTTSKKMTEDVKKHKRLAIFNLLALVIVIVILALSGRGILSMSAFS
jgi:uncharacterized membrane protein